MPLVDLDHNDAARNIAMYVPLGVLLGLMSRARSARMFGMLVLAIGGVSLAFECTQWFVPGRFPSVDDVIFNTLGGALGLWFSFWLMQRMVVGPLPD
jgi:glycopeptide antibiotics resistance protein